MTDGRNSLLGVGLLFHPLLFVAIRDGRFEYDFLEAPTDFYLDPARAALLDPNAARLRQIVGGKSCVWRGAALSLGSVPSSRTPEIPTEIVGRLRRLLGAVPGVAMIEAIGTVNAGQGATLPRTRAAARWIAARWRAASRAFDVPILLRPARPGPAHRPDELDPFDCLEMIGDLTGCEFVVDLSDLEALSAAAGIDASRGLARLANLRLGAASLTGTSDDEWKALRELCATAAPPAVVVRRSAFLFPLDAIAESLVQARNIWRSGVPAADVPPRTSTEALEFDQLDVEQWHRWQTDFIEAGNPKSQSPTIDGKVAATRIWRARVDETYKGQEIRKLIAGEARMNVRGALQ